MGIPPQFPPVMPGIVPPPFGYPPPAYGFSPVMSNPMINAYPPAPAVPVVVEPTTPATPNVQQPAPTSPKVEKISNQRLIYEDENLSMVSIFNIQTTNTLRRKNVQCYKNTNLKKNKTIQKHLQQTLTTIKSK
jgi:hypothetical protein